MAKPTDCQQPYRCAYPISPPWSCPYPLCCMPWTSKQCPISSEENNRPTRNIIALVCFSRNSHKRPLVLRSAKSYGGTSTRPRKIRIDGEKSAFVTRPMKSQASGPSQLTRRG
eukprot:scaffold145335_cov84-Attheya_sp.AAC.1